MQAIGSYILITKSKSENKERSSGFITADNERYKKGTIVSVGSLVTSVSPDDEIYFDGNQGHDQVINEIEYRVITERDVAIKI